MSVRISVKETLAKLMATENILVEHANIPTAGFDLVNRKLLLPNWKNISDDVYTLLISHEVGHALFTPKDEWADEILKTKDPSFKQVVNVVEDVRIEKLIQQKYPGTVRAFKSGYDELEKANLFGTKNRDINSYGLIDRLNLHFKIGHFGYAKVPFSPEERPWLDRISSCKSFADVLKVAADLKQYVEDHPESQGENQQSQDEQSSEVSPSDMQSNSSGQQKNVEFQPQDMQGGNNQQSQDGDQDSMSPQSGNQQSSRSNSAGDGTTQSDSDEPVFSETQKHFDSAIQSLVDKSVLDTKYANLPHIELDKLIVPYKTVHNQISNYYASYHSNFYEQARQHVEQFKQSNKNVVNQLANLFEMKKKAKLDVKALVSKTGKLDMNRVHSYRYNDDVFKKLTTIPQGKSHGLVMFIDMSSSMNENLAGTFEQLLNLVLFCRRVNIPFDVYGFTDSYYARRGLEPLAPRPGCLSFESTFCLRHYFSNKMSGTEFNQALQNIVCMMRYYSGQSFASIPVEESLNTTPLVPTILTAIPLIQRFRQEYNLDIVNTVFLTDGEDTHGLLYQTDAGELKYFNTERYGGYRKSAERCYVRDPKTHKTWQVTDSTKDVLNILRELAGVKTIGFHIVRKREIVHNISRYTQDYNQEQKHLESFKNHKFIEINNIVGYDAYYLIPSGNSLNVSADEFSSHVDTTVDWNDQKQAKKAMKTVQKDFANFMKQKVTSRILLNRFIDHIS